MNTPPPATDATDRVFAEIPTRRGEQLRVGLSPYKNNWFFTLRIWFLGDDDVWKPTSKGANVKLEHLPAIDDAVGKALEAARDEGLL